jgi:chromosome segregation ATPase
VKEILLRICERLGYVVLRIEVWKEFLQRQANIEASYRSVEAQLQANIEASQRSVAAQLKGQESCQHNQSEQLESQLASLTSERHFLATRIGRAQARVQALRRRRGHLQAELMVVREQLACRDTTGRIRELETENRRLWQRLADLETYLEETRASSRPYYL